MTANADDRCQICRQPLTDNDAVTCINCVNNTRNTINDIVDLYGQLPDAIATITGISYEGTTSRSSDVHVPGGQALVLLGGGTDNSVTSSRTGWRDHVVDHYPDDPPSAAGVLATIEDDWRNYRSEPAAPYAPDINRCAEYLLKHVAWAARVHPAYPDTVRRLRHLRTRMERVTGNTPPTQPPSVAPCITCGQQLRQRWNLKLDRLEHECVECGRIHDQIAYDLAVRAMTENARQNPDLILTARQARDLHGLSDTQVHVWERRGKIEPTGHTDTGVKLFSNADIMTLRNTPTDPKTKDA